MVRKQFNWQLPPEIEKRLGDTTYGRQRAIFEAGHLLLILHAPPVVEQRGRETKVFLRTPDGRYFCNGAEGGDTKLRKLVDAYERLSEEYDKACEEAIDATALFRLIERLAPVSRAATNLYGALQSARELVRDDKFLIAVRDEAYEVSRSLELILAEARTAMDYRLARHAEAQAEKAEEMARSQHKLNVMAALTFPLMAVATVFGMNLFHGLEGYGPLAFWAIFAAGLVVGLATKNWVVINHHD